MEMTFLDLVKKRKSVRQFQDKEIEQEKLDYILECARLAPSAANAQPWYFYVIRDMDIRQSIQQAYLRQWFTTAPVYIVACGDTHASWKRQSDGKDHCDVDIAIAVEHICLAATEQGLGTCWVCNFDVEKCKQALNLSAGMQPIAIIPVGYPAADTQDTVRKPLKDITRTI